MIDKIEIDTGLVTLSLKENNFNDMYNLNVKVDESIIDFMSLEHQYNEYKESSHKGLEKIYSKSFKNANAKLEKAVKAFDSEIKKVLDQMSKDLGKL